MAAPEGEDPTVEALAHLRHQLGDARVQTQHALQGLTTVAKEAEAHGSGAGLGAVAEALGVAQAWAGRTLALAEAIGALTEGARIDDPTVLGVEAVTAATSTTVRQAAAGLRLLAGGGEQPDVELPAGGGEVVAIPWHLAKILGVEDPGPEPEPAAPALTEVPRLPGLSERASTISHIRTALRERSGKRWSVCGGRGTAYSWITISAPDMRLDANGTMTDADTQELHRLLSMGGAVRPGSISVEARRRLEFVRRARGEHTAPYYPGAGPE